jgi:hypothetical protein
VVSIDHHEAIPNFNGQSAAGLASISPSAGRVSAGQRPTANGVVFADDGDGLVEQSALYCRICGKLLDPGDWMPGVPKNSFNLAVLKIAIEIVRGRHGDGARWVRSRLMADSCWSRGELNHIFKQQASANSIVQRRISGVMRTYP